jgi:DnaK suppressor protein
MDKGTFGLCEECDAEIPVKRLRVRPDATLCLYCQETAEKERSGIRAVSPGSFQLIQ